jgi:hypothetical protein
MNAINISQAQQLSEALNRYKTEITELVALRLNTPPQQRQGSADTVDITNIGRLLYDLSKTGSTDFKEIVSSVIEGRPDARFDTFMQAYCAVYGVDYTSQMIRYDRYGRGSYSEYYAALKKYFAAFGDYLLDDSDDENDVPRNLKKSFKKALQKFVAFFK